MKREVDDLKRATTTVEKTSYLYKTDDPSVADVKDKKKRLDKAESFLADSKKLQIDIAHVLANKKVKKKAGGGMYPDSSD